MANENQPSFQHREEVARGFEHLFTIYQLPDPRMREALAAAMLVQDSITLLSGTYGTGKTQFVHLLRKIFYGDGRGGYDYDYETCHQDLTAFDVLYHLDLAELQRGNEVVHPKQMITARLKFLNEIQRAGTSFFNALLPFFSEHRVTYRDVVFDVPDFVCLMDRNPQDSGSSEIPEAFLDRVDFSFDLEAMRLPEMLELQELRRREDGIHWGDLADLAEPVLLFEQLAEVWRDVTRVEIPRRSLILGGLLTDSLRVCIEIERSTARVDFDLPCDNCQYQGEICSHLFKVPGQRVTNSMFRLAQAMAWVDGRSSVSAEHLLAALPWCLSHRLALRPEELRKKPSLQTWILDTALREILLPKMKTWNQAIEAFEGGDLETLTEIGGRDHVVAELVVLLESDSN